MTVPYLPFERLPEEIQSEIVEKLTPEAHAKVATLSKSLKRITDVTKCKKKAEYYKSKNKDPVREVVKDNDIECFQYFIDHNFPVYWGAVVEMVYLKRNDMLRLYDFEVRNKYRIALLLRILIETNNMEGYEILKPRIRNDQKFRARVYSFKTESNANLVDKIKQDMPNFHGSASKPFQKISAIVKSTGGGDIQDIAPTAIIEAILEDDVEAIKILDEMGYFRYNPRWLSLPIEKDIMEYLIQIGFDLDNFFMMLVNTGNLYSAENALDAGFKPSRNAINEILMFLRSSANSGDLLPEDILEWLYSRHLISKEEYDEIMNLFM